MEESSYVTIFVCTDPVEAEMLKDLMEQNGVNLRVFGLQYGASIGIGQNAVDIRFTVDREQVKLAESILDEFFDGDTAVNFLGLEPDQTK
jgi:hypothetical protein